MEEITLTKETIIKFEHYLRDEEKSDATVEKYVRDITVFMSFLNDGVLSKNAAIEYKRYLLNKGYASRSVNSVIASINSFFNYADLNDFKLKSIKIQREVYCSEDKELTKNEYMRLIDAANKKSNNRLSLIIETIGSTGIRISELKFITIDAVKRGEAIVSCKGKTRRVFMVKALKKKLLRYAAEQKIKSGCIFITRTGKPLNRCNIWREMKKICDEAGVNPQKVFPHNLRHLFARVFYSLEKDIAKLADVLGHSSINTTRIYIITTGYEHRRHMENMHLTV